MKRNLRLAATTAMAISVGLSIVVQTTPVAAAPTCPSVAAVRAAVGVVVTQPESDTCAFRVGDDTITYEFVPSAKVATDMAARRSDAVRRTAPVTKVKVGRYPGFTGTASGVAQIFWNQKGTVVYISHQEINAQSADVLKRSSTALSKITVPAKIRSCAAITKAVVGAVPGAKAVPGSEGSCRFDFADGTTMFVGIQSDDSYSGWLDTYEAMTDRPAVEDVTFGSQKGFAFVTDGTYVVVPMTDSIAIVSLNLKSDSPLRASLTVKAAAAIS